MTPNLAQQLSLAAKSLHSGQLVQAQAQCQQILARHPGSADALHLLGLVHARAGNDREAARLLAEAARLQPQAPAAHNNLGIALKRLGRTGEAIASFEQAIALRPDYADAHGNLGSALLDAGRHEQALASLDRAIALRGDLAPAHGNRGRALLALGRPDEALESLDRALALRPDLADAQHNHGVALAQLRRWAEALRAFDAAIGLRPGDANLHCDRGNALLGANRLDEAIAAFRQALALDPGLDDARSGLGEACLRAKRHAEAADAFAALVASAPEYPFAIGNLLHARMLCCDWHDLDALRERIAAGLSRRAQVVEPFVFQGIAESEADLRVCAEIHAASQCPPADAPARGAAPVAAPEKVVIGYLSGEFRQQATSILMCGVYERHDRDRFRLVALDNGGSDGSDYRRRIDASFDRIVDIRGLGDRDAADLVRALNVDVLVDLNGYFGDGRPGVFARRPCAIQVNYLGFPGTLGAGCYDYLIADRTVIPADCRRHYAEKIVDLPDCYQANDDRRAVAPLRQTRAEAGLPPQAFVFCCFNNSYKITPRTFDSWMRILRLVDGSVLWLLQPDPAAASNLRREAQRRGIDGERLLFAPHLPPAEHLARHALADLFLDTLPYNAHTTASDALWAGLPVLTLVGTTFAGRVGASLLRAVGLPELITTGEAEFEAAAVDLATGRDRLAAIRSRLRRNAATAPLFDTARFTRHLEAAYLRMVQRQRDGLPPEHFSVGCD